MVQNIVVKLLGFERLEKQFVRFHFRVAHLLHAGGRECHVDVGEVNVDHFSKTVGRILRVYAFNLV